MRAVSVSKYVFRWSFVPDPGIYRVFSHFFLHSWLIIAKFIFSSRTIHILCYQKHSLLDNVILLWHVSGYGSLSFFNK